MLCRRFLFRGSHGFTLPISLLEDGLANNGFNLRGNYSWISMKFGRIRECLPWWLPMLCLDLNTRSQSRLIHQIRNTGCWHNYSRENENGNCLCEMANNSQSTLGSVGV
mmetsp:Transcript_28649/g.61117  ORF Transcript_28649/g.61117 Transcript_28649/m.61117 type:complete len:109 (+) Transcript_28649:212-538(+)